MVLQTDGSSFQRRVAPHRRRNPGVIRPIYAGVFDLSPTGYEHAREAVLNWVRNNVAVREFIGTLDADEIRPRARRGCAYSAR